MDRAAEKRFRAGLPRAVHRADIHARRQLADEEKHYVLLRRRNVVVGLLGWIIPAAVLVGVPVAITVAWHRLMPNGI